jgi:predicted DNA-binding protein
MADRKGREVMDKNVTVRMSADMYARLVALAEADRRRVGEYVRLRLEDLLPALERKGREGEGQ